MNIPIFKLEFEKDFLEKFRKISEEILTSNRPLSENKYVKEFEDKFSKLVGSRYAVAVTNGTVAIELALKALNVKNKIVLTPSNTFFATTVAITNAGGEIGLVEAEEENFSLDPVDLEKQIKRYKALKKEIGAVVIVHIGGIISKNIRKIIRICKKYKIPLVEDAAHAHCSTFEDLSAGTIGKVGCFSFFPTKVMTSGEGGMVTTNDKKIYELVKSLKDFGRDLNNGGICVNPNGNNFKVTELTGLLGSLECDRVLGRIKKRNKLSDVYVKKLKDSRYMPILQSKGRCSQYKMILMTDIDTDWLKTYCKKHNISLTGEVYKIPVHKQPLYLKEFETVKLPVTDRISKSHICPPLYPELSENEVNYVCEVLLKAENEYEK